jgi:hypothetical protein
MLTNTVGVMLFIMIFTVLTAGGAVVARRLPMEHDTNAKPLFFVCVRDRLLPVPDAIGAKFLEPLGKPKSYDEVGAWVQRYNARRIEDEYFVITGKGDARYMDLGVQKQASLDLSIWLTPKEGAGATVADLQDADARFRQILREYQPKDHFVYFLVYPDSLTIFEKAREAAIQMNFGTGWDPRGHDDRVSFCLTGDCRKAIQQ